MLFIQCLTSIVGLVLFISPLVTTLPIHPALDSNGGGQVFANRRMTLQEEQHKQQSWFAPSALDDSTTSPLEDHTDDIDESDFYVDLNRFSQLLSAHIMTEHLDSAVTTLSKKLAAQIQNSVQLIIRPYDSTATEQQPWNYQNNDDDEDVDIRLLIEQLEGAVGSYIEDQLPTLWYRHPSFAALDSVSLRSFMEQTVLTHCPLVKLNGEPVTDDELIQQQQHRYISHQCLQPFARTFSTSLDDFIKQNMQSTLVEIVRDDLPHLLIRTDNHLLAILNHFNTFLLSARSQLLTDLTSLQNHQHATSWSFLSDVDTVGALLDSISDGENKADSLIHSMHQYSVLAKVSIAGV
ncbi:hypothetical protein BCR42DRAFT_399797 [Absidia repens]|uniref:Uncharacterized protein n=1 Tax=Absidia repens TaxID=90262 RepID=A0A1X2J0E6_9FUNG|nr:hypothetical protein BCR42DRAFT_399797 [Absidia repens]